MIFTVDYHFHPNLPRNHQKAIAKCSLWWKKLEEIGINTVIITEHSYKKPKRAFDLMKKTKPKDFYIFPGLEYLTKEGIDIIIFSNDGGLYNYEELKHSGLTFDEVIYFIQENNLASFITHPHTVGLTSIIAKLGESKYFFYVNKLESVEIVNTGPGNICNLLKKPVLKTIFNKKVERIEKTITLPQNHYPEKIKFLAAGSDAHHPEELGTFVTLEATPKTLFEKIISNKSPVVTNKIYRSTSYFLLIKTGVTAFSEFTIKKSTILKKLLGRKAIDKKSQLELS